MVPAFQAGKDILYMAPLQGYTEVYFRNAFARHFGGIDLAMAPFISIVAGKGFSKRHMRDVLPNQTQLIPVIPQILGNDSQPFIDLAHALYDMGYQRINWNLGCPVKVVVRKGRGSGWLPFPDKIDRFLNEVIPQIPNQLSVKVRLGMEHERELFDLVPVFNQYPLDEVIIHPRTRAQMYEGVANQAMFAELLPRIVAPVVYNGDINSVEAFESVKLRFPSVNRWMIGRGLVHYPALARAIQSGRKADLYFSKDDFYLFHNDLINALQERMQRAAGMKNKVKDLWTIWAHWFDDPEGVFNRIKRIEQMPEYWQLFEAILKNEKWTAGID